MALKQTSFKVEGRGPFPIDMLRYDSAWPATGADASIIENLNHVRERRTVTLNSIGIGAPTIARWNSFLWRVVYAETGTWKASQA